MDGGAHCSLLTFISIYTRHLLLFKFLMKPNQITQKCALHMEKKWKSTFCACENKFTISIWVNGHSNILRFTCDICAVKSSSTNEMKKKTEQKNKQNTRYLGQNKRTD